MKTASAALLFALAAGLAQAEAADAGRERIRAERAAVDARFEAEEKACYGKFGVNDCLAAARKLRNQAVAGLRRQELELNDAERKRRAAERLGDFEARQAQENAPEAAARRQRAEADRKEREARAAGKAAQRAGRVASPETPPQPEAPRPVTPTGTPRAAEAFEAPAIDAAAAARNRDAFEARRQAAAAHKAEVLERNARRGKPAAPPLPPP